MSPQDFAEYWGLTPQQLAQVLGVSVTTVYQWNTTTPESRRTPDRAAVRQATLIHLTWMRWLAEDKCLPSHIRETYEEIRGFHIMKPLRDDQGKPTAEQPSQASD
jgi:hypothetical protein